MFFCARLADGGVHNFLGWAFPHCTSYATVRKKCHIFTTNTDEENPSLILAWGPSGGQEHMRNQNMRVATRRQNMRVATRRR